MPAKLPLPPRLGRAVSPCCLLSRWCCCASLRVAGPRARPQKAAQQAEASGATKEQVLQTAKATADQAVQVTINRSAVPPARLPARLSVLQLQGTCVVVPAHGKTLRSPSPPRRRGCLAP